jgi:hypothetical protein
MVPKFTPQIVILELPKDAPLELVNVEIEPSSNENACVVSATAPVNPMVTEAPSVVPVLVVILQDTEDTEIQLVDSHPVCPSVPIWDTLSGPKPSPYNTIEATPSTCRFGVRVVNTSTPLK